MRLFYLINLISIAVINAVPLDVPITPEDLATLNLAVTSVLDAANVEIPKQILLNNLDPLTNVINGTLQGQKNLRGFCHAGNITLT